MTNKVQKIREEIKKLHGNPYYMMAVKDVLAIIDSLQEEHVSEELEEVSDKYGEDIESNYSNDMFDRGDIMKAFEAGANWQKEHLWKSADGNELPEIDREVVAFQETFPTDVDVPSLLKIVIAHRPNPEGYDGKSITTGQAEHYTPKTYGKCGWNIPNVKYWLDIELPKEIEL